MIWLLAAALSIQSFADTVLIQSPGSASSEYRAMLKAHADFITPVREYLRSHPALAQRELLLKAFADAQAVSLEKSNEEARAQFIAVLDLMNQDDWEKSDREIFLQTYLRLAQMETDAGRRDQWLGLSLLLGEANLDASLYPPPLLTRRAELAKSLPRKNLARKFLSAGWSAVLLNGQVCENHICEAWPLSPGKVRLTLLSDQWQSQSTWIDPADIERFSPRSQPLAEGSCEAPRLSKVATKMADVKVFWGLNCQPENSAIHLNPRADAASPSPLFASEAPQPRPLLQSKWFWIGVAATVAVIVVANSQKKESQETTTTYGFR
jgi:hypothetical protein